MALNDFENPEKARRAQDVEEPLRISSSSEFHGGRGVCIFTRPPHFKKEKATYQDPVCDCEGPRLHIIVSDQRSLLYFFFE